MNEAKVSEARWETLKEQIAEGYTSLSWRQAADDAALLYAEAMRLRDINKDLLAALRKQPDDPRGCTCLSMTAYNCPFCLKSAAIRKAEGK